MTILHLTMQGPRAGQTFCTAPKNNKDRYIHGFAPGSERQIQAERELHSICPDCLNVYDSVMADDAPGAWYE